MDSESEQNMQQRLIKMLERELEDAIAEALEQLADKLPLSPEDHTIHAMAKAAVTVYEAVTDADRMGRPHH